MQRLLLDIVARLTEQLRYLHWVGVLDDELLPPEFAAPPFVGVKDGGVQSLSIPGQHDRETLIVWVTVYQGVQLDEPGASVVGSEAQLGEIGKGLLLIHADIRAALNDYLFSNRFYFAHREALDPSRVLTNDTNFLSMQRATYHYMRIN